MKKRFKNGSEAEAFLQAIPKFANTGAGAANFDLARMLKFCRLMGNPQQSFKTIHVAGTNGKGTVCRMLASVYQSARYKTGLYTSPHLMDVLERFRVNSRCIVPDLFLEFFNRFGNLISKNRYTYFEITTALAFWSFAKQKVEIAVIETGLGGRLDATNVIEPEISVITSIDLDHTDLLGNTLKDIAFEKGGIIKPGIPIVIGKLPDEAEKEIIRISSLKKSELIHAVDFRPNFKEHEIVITAGTKVLRFDGSGRKKIDARNTAIAYAVISRLRHHFRVTDQAFKHGIEKLNERITRRGTFEKLDPNRQWYFDGAHNPESVKHLADHMLGIAGEEQWSVVLSVMRDKLNDKMADTWNRFSKVYIFEMDADRAATIEEMRTYFPGSTVISEDHMLNKNQFETELVIFSGSFYFYSVVSKWMGTIIASEKNLSALNL